MNPAMTSTGKLSSYFSRRRDPRSMFPPEEDSAKPTASVRARLEKKLQIRQKASFAFNFTVDGDKDDLQEERGQEAFHFDFNPPGTTNVGEGAKERKEKSSGGGNHPRAAEDFAVEIEERRARPNTKNKSNKGTGKKKKGGKRKAKSAEKEAIPYLVSEQQPQRDPATKPRNSSAMGDGTGRTSNCCLSLAEEGGSDPRHDDAGQGSSTPDCIRDTATSGMLRPPPGFTLESWKDPALSGEERRRRRFGSGVRNMIAIQRSSAARRGTAVGGESEPEGFLGRRRDLIGPDSDRARGDGSIQAAVPGDTAVGGPSVFSFGFDIGISFNGGS